MCSTRGSQPVLVNKGQSHKSVFLISHCHFEVLNFFVFVVVTAAPTQLTKALVDKVASVVHRHITFRNLRRNIPTILAQLFAGNKCFASLLSSIFFLDNVSIVCFSRDFERMIMNAMNSRMAIEVYVRNNENDQLHNDMQALQARLFGGSEGWSSNDDTTFDSAAGFLDDDPNEPEPPHHLIEHVSQQHYLQPQHQPSLIDLENFSSGSEYLGCSSPIDDESRYIPIFEHEPQHLLDLEQHDPAEQQGWTNGGDDFDYFSEVWTNGGDNFEDVHAPELELQSLPLQFEPPQQQPQQPFLQHLDQPAEFIPAQQRQQSPQHLHSVPQQNSPRQQQIRPPFQQPEQQPRFLQQVIREPQSQQQGDEEMEETLYGHYGNRSDYAK